MKSYRPPQDKWGTSKSTRKPRQKKDLPVSSAWETALEEVEQEQPLAVQQDEPQEQPPAKPRSKAKRHGPDPSVKTPTDLAQYFANSVSTEEHPYRPFEWMVVWFTERLGETRWCGPTPEVPVLMSVGTYVLAIDHWAAQNRHLVGRQIWEAWAEWIDQADLLDEGVVGYSTGPSTFDRRLAAEAKDIYGIEIDPEEPFFRARISQALEAEGTSVAQLSIERRERAAKLARAKRYHEVAVEDAEEQGLTPPTLEETMAELEERDLRNAKKREAARLERLAMEDEDDDLPDLPDEDPDEEPPRTGFAPGEAEALLAKLAAAGEAWDKAHEQRGEHHDG